MTRYERISIALAIVALVIAVAGPFITYRWLDPELQSFSNRAKLQVVGKPVGSFILYTLDEPITLPQAYEVEITNTGKLPAKDIKIVLRYDDEPQFDDQSTFGFNFDTPTVYEVETKYGQRILALNRPLPPNDKVKITFRNLPNLISVANEFGETTILDTGLSATGIRIAAWREHRFNNLAPINKSKK
jgi:hypothetical protein